MFTVDNFSPAAADARDIWRKHLAKPQLYPRDKEFSELILHVTEGLQSLCTTKNRVLLLGTSGTAALECAIASLPPEKKIIVIRNGYFGNRLYKIANFHFQDVYAFDLPFGQPFEEVHKTALVTFAKKKKANVIICAHLETSSTVLNNAALISRIGKTLNAITIIDGVSSLGSIECKLEDCDVDCFVSSAYKALMCPAGLSFIIANDEFLAEATRKWSYAHDLKRLTAAAQENRFLWSPNVLSLQCLTGVIYTILRKGQKTYFKELEEKTSHFRSRLSQAGFEIFGDADHLSACFTALKLPEPNAGEWLDRLKGDYGFVIGKGLGESSENYLRIGHYPNKSPAELDRLTTALSETSRKVKGVNP